MFSERKMNQQFSPQLLAQAKELTSDVKPANQRPLVNGITIDSKTSKDLDDAIWVEKEDDNFLIWVSIADVSHFIEKDSHLDKEAFNRIETQYLAHSNIPMLPSILSEGSLSLFENSERLTLTVHFKLNEISEIIDVSIYESILKSKKRFDYEEADQTLNLPDKPFYQILKNCQQLAQQLFSRRQNRGALALFDLTKAVFMDEEGHLRPLDVERAYHSHLIIQELMIITNEAVAQFLAGHNLAALYRNHTPQSIAPDRNEMLTQLNLSILRSDLLRTLDKKLDLWLKKASYEPILKGHFGLNLPAYLHFTSPIRRLPDLINHRIIKACISSQPSPYSLESLNEISEYVNSKIQKVSEKREHYFRQKRVQMYRKQLENNSSKELENLSGHDFTKILKYACLDNNLTPALKTTIESKLNEPFILPIHLYYLLFETSKEKKWDTLKLNAFKQIEERPHFAVTMMSLLIQNKSNWHSFEFDTQTLAAQYFASWTLVKIKEQVLTTTQPSMGNNKKVTQQEACLNWLRDYLKGTLCSPDQKLLVTFQAPTRSSTYEGENYVGLLNSLSQKNNWTFPKYSFTQNGDNHLPEFTCSCLFSLNDEQLITSGKAITKKDAKQFAAQELYNILSERGLIQRLNQESNHSKSLNPISKLQEFCASQHFALPKYDYTEQSINKDVIFCCKCQVELNQKSYTGLGEAPSKKIAKRLAAEDVLLQIES